MVRRYPWKAIHAHLASYNNAIASVKANPKIAILGGVSFLIASEAVCTLFGVYSFFKEIKINFVILSNF